MDGHPWWIVDTATDRAYVSRGWKTKNDAQLVLYDLLRPYPRDHEWRKRIVVEFRPTMNDVLAMDRDALDPVVTEVQAET